MYSEQNSRATRKDAMLHKASCQSGRIEVLIVCLDIRYGGSLVREIQVGGIYVEGKFVLGKTELFLVFLFVSNTRAKPNCRKCSSNPSEFATMSMQSALRNTTLFNFPCMYFVFQYLPFY